jgi:HEAT repeat protein
VVIVRRYGISIILIISIISLDSFIEVKNKAQIHAKQDTEEFETLEEEAECPKGNREQENVSKNKEAVDEKLLQKEINRLIKELAEGDIIDQYKAGRKLKKIGKPAVPALIDAIKGDDKRLRKVAMIVLGQIKDKRTVPVLIEELEKTKDKKMRAGLIIILGRIGDKRASPTLMKALNEKSEEIVAAAAYSLGKLKEEKATPLLIPLLSHSSEYIRQTVTKAIEKIGDPAIPILIKDMEQRPLNTRYLIVNILGKIGGEQAVDTLLVTLKDNNEYIRLSSAYALSELGNNRGYNLAIQYLNHSRPEYQFLAIKTLEKLGKKIVWDERKREYVVLK